MAIQNELPRSRLTLTYQTTVNGATQKINLPLRLMVLGDFSAGQYADQEKDLENRPLRAINGNNLSSVMQDMKFTLKLHDVQNCIDDSGGIDVELPMTSMRSFSPDEIVQHVPKLKSLLLMRKMIQELQGQIDNQSGLRKEIQQLFSDKAAVEALKQELANFRSLQLQAQPQNAANAQSGAAKSLTPGS